MSDVRTPLDWMRRHRDHHQPDPSPVQDIAKALETYSATLNRFVEQYQESHPALKETRR